MFMKFLLTVAVIAVIWFGFKYMSRLAELRQKREAEVPPRRPVGVGPIGGSRGEAVEDVHDMVKCGACGTWQPARSSRSCGRADCPY